MSKNFVGVLDDYKKVLKQLKNYNDINFIKDILKMMLININHQEIVNTTISKIGIHKESQYKINKIIGELHRMPDIHIKNDGAVIHYKENSMGCQDCIKDFGCTLRITTRCNRNCFFCFADNAPIRTEEGVDIELLKKIILARRKEVEFRSFAISGGEPFLYPDAVYEILHFINNKFGDHIYTRVYTNGDFVDGKILKELKNAKLDEIRYSIKPFEKPRVDLLKNTKKFIPVVLIEMPVLPDTEQFMRNLIYELDTIGINGINLLELFFNGYHNEAFIAQKYKIDFDIEEIRKIYNTKPLFEYPIYGSKMLCLRLLKYFASKRINFPINFCSQTTKQLQYDEKNKRVAIKNKPVYSKITNNFTHKILAIYTNIDEARGILLQHRIKDFFERHDDSCARRLETSVDNFKYFKNGNFLSAIIYRDPNNLYDVDFELWTVTHRKYWNEKVKKIIDDFGIILYEKQKNIE